jgi:hypothetical protein
MSDFNFPRSWIRVAATIPAVLMAALLAGSATAQTACVRCFGPEQVYRCEAVSDLPVEENAVGLFCVSRIAADHAHASCAVQRAGDGCEGVQVSYDYGDQQQTGLLPEAAAADETGTGGEPATLGEFTKDTVDASARGVKKAGENIGNVASKAGSATADAIKDAGDAIGNATKKTLKCLGSALNDC